MLEDGDPDCSPEMQAKLEGWRRRSEAIAAAKAKGDSRRAWERPAAELGGSPSRIQEFLPQPARATLVEPALSEVDRELLLVLDSPERKSYAQLASRLGVSKKAIRCARDRLVKLGKIEHVSGGPDLASRWIVRKGTPCAPAGHTKPAPLHLVQAFFESYVSAGTLSAVCARARGSFELLHAIYVSLQQTKRRAREGGDAREEEDIAGTARVLQTVGFEFGTAIAHARRQTSGWVVRLILTTLAKEQRGKIGHGKWLRYVTAALAKRFARPSRESFRADRERRARPVRMRLVRGDAG